MIKKEYLYAIIGGSTFIFALFLYAYLTEAFVLYIPSYGTYLSIDEKAGKITKKNVLLYFWDGHALHHEREDIMWSHNPIDNINHVIQQQLLLFYEEKITSDKMSLQTALLSPSGQDLYLSFNKTFFDKESSIHHKLMMIESILKTLRNIFPPSIQVHFLVNHLPLPDTHLDFSQPWPL